MTILYCDDDKTHLEYMENIFGKCFPDDKLVTTDCPSGLLEQGCNETDIFLLDIDYNLDKDGIDYATILSRKYPASRIIYVTAYTERFVESAFLNNKNVCGFLKKPVQEESLINAVTKAKEELLGNGDIIIIKPTDMKLAAIQTSRLMFIESLGHKIIYKTFEREYKVIDKLSHAILALPQSFVCCHKSFVVNMQTIAQLEKNNIILTNGSTVPISASRKKEFFDAYYKFIESRGGI